MLIIFGVGLTYLRLFIFWGGCLSGVSVVWESPCLFWGGCLIGGGFAGGAPSPLGEGWDGGIHQAKSFI